MQELIESVGQLSAKQRKALAVLLKQKGVNLFDIAPVFKRTAEEPLLLSYAQQRQWFLWQLDPDSAAYHVPGALRLNGRLDKAALQRSFDTLLAQEQEAIALWWLEAETMNGRLDQYFWNSAGDQALIALRGLHSLHMPITSKAFGTAAVPCAMNAGLAFTNNSTGVTKAGKRHASSPARSGETKRGLWG